MFPERRHLKKNNVLIHWHFFFKWALPYDDWGLIFLILSVVEYKFLSSFLYI